MGLTDFPHFPVLPAPLSCLQETCCPQEPGDSAATKLQLQEATERQTELCDTPTCPQLVPVPQDSRTGPQLSVLSTTDLRDPSVFPHFQDHP